MSDSNFNLFRLVDGNWVEYNLSFTGKIATSKVFSDEEIFNLYDNNISEETIIETITNSADKEIIVYRTSDGGGLHPRIEKIAGRFSRVRHCRVFLKEAANVTLDGKYKRPCSFGRGVMDYNESYTENGIHYSEILGISYEGGAIFRGRLGDLFCEGKWYANRVDNPRPNGCLIC